MSEQNKKLVRDLWSAAEKRDFAKMGGIYGEDVVYHGPSGEEHKGREALVNVARNHLDPFPDMKLEIERLVGEGNYVVARVRLTGTNTAKLMGMSPTGKKLDLKWVMQMVRIQNGKIAEEWEILDQMDFMKQLGLPS